jgi:uncharacterized protein (DUF4415 family)
MSKKDTEMNGVVRRSFDLANLPPLTDAQQKEIAALEAMPDADIDTSDIPSLGEQFWQTAEANPFYRPVKTSTTVRIDADVLAWLRSQGKGYQSRINAILRKAMVGSKEQMRAHPLR